MKEKFKRIFLIVIDSVGIGSDNKAYKYHDKGANTLKHIAESCNGLSLPTLESLGLGDIISYKGLKRVSHPHSYAMKAKEKSNGKDTITGHWEMMGIKTINPFITFTDTGFPNELIQEIEKQTGHKIIGNYAASGTEIIKVLGEEQKRDNSLIVYTSADSVLQIAAHEEATGLEELYRCCKITRNITMKKEWNVARIIARPFLGDNKDNFYRTPNRHDYSVLPPQKTYLDLLTDNGIDVISIGKINDIFSGQGIKNSIKTKSNHEGMNEIQSLLKRDFKGFVFANLVEFDSEYGHRRNPEGYKNALIEFDNDLKSILPDIKEDDLLIITADHGNDPTWAGTDHTREKVPLILYSPKFNKGRKLKERNTFADIGATIIKNYNIIGSMDLIGKEIK